MFVMTMAETFHVGDTAPCRINGCPATLHWRDEQTLVINGTDARRILMLDRGTDGAGRACRTFTCGDAGSARREAPAVMAAYPDNWPRCVFCGAPVLDGHLTCGRLPCSEAKARDMVRASMQVRGVEAQTGRDGD